MNKSMGMVVLFVAMSLGAGPILAADPMKEKEVKPTISERLTKEGIKGTLARIDGDYYVIQDNDDEQHRVHVDKSTKLDKVVAGDKVKAFVTRKAM